MAVIPTGERGGGQLPLGSPLLLLPPERPKPGVRTSLISREADWRMQGRGTLTAAEGSVSRWELSWELGSLT